MRAPDSLFYPIRQAACLALLTPLAALAQGAPPQDAARPDAPTAPLVHAAMPPAPQGDTAPSHNAWREAHEAVAEFPRGHADILAWEKQAAASGGQPPRAHKHPGGSKP